MPERRITIEVSIDLARKSKNAHEVTIKKIAKELGGVAQGMMESNGYQVRQIKVRNLMHYVRHDNTVTIFRAAKRHLKRVV